ncbi:MAG: DUF2851 family protein [Prevotellaceae bacterium]|nr:DUF2851 family protein [Prevotellaceae bacterium]
MEQLLHYVWKHKITPPRELTTTDGRTVEIIDSGLHNRNAGPDFFNAKVKIDGQLWVGNVEIHQHSKDWYLHGHDTDSAYDNVILHVVETADAIVSNSRGEILPQLELSVPQHIADNYAALMAADNYPPCYKIIPQLSKLTIHSWMSALQTERLEQKTDAIRLRAERLAGSWEDALFITLARNYGFGINGDAFEQWALNLHLNCVAHHRDDLFQIEAMFMGQAGLLDIASIPPRHQQAALADPYYTKLAAEYRYLAHKFSLTPMDCKLWKFLRLRPQNFPHIRISQLANLYYERRLSLSTLVNCSTVAELSSLLGTHVTPYWATHYAFGVESAHNGKSMSPFSINLLLVNTAIPMLFAYGRHIANEQLCLRAFDLLEQLKPENNHVVRMWRECGLEVDNAGDTQALLQLKKMYCDRHDCLRCRIGYEYLKKS